MRLCRSRTCSARGRQESDLTSLTTKDKNNSSNSICCSSVGWPGSRAASTRESEPRSDRSSKATSPDGYRRVSAADCPAPRDHDRRRSAETVEEGTAHAALTACSLLASRHHNQVRLEARGPRYRRSGASESQWHGHNGVDGPAGDGYRSRSATPSRVHFPPALSGSVVVASALKERTPSPLSPTCPRHESLETTGPEPARMILCNPLVARLRL